MRVENVSHHEGSLNSLTSERAISDINDVVPHLTTPLLWLAVIHDTAGCEQKAKHAMEPLKTFLKLFHVESLNSW